MLDNTRKLLLAFVTLILGAVLVVVIATNALAVTAKTNIYDESTNLATSCITGLEFVNESNSACNITATNYPTSWKITDCPLASVTVENTSAGTYTAIEEGTDYNLFASTGIIQMLNTTDTDAGDFNTTYINYAYCKDTYLNSGWGRSVTNIVAGFFAIALLLVSVGLFYDVARDTGLIRT